MPPGPLIIESNSVVSAMTSGISWMEAWWLLILIVVILVGAAAIKYLFFNKRD